MQEFSDEEWIKGMLYINFEDIDWEYLKKITKEEGIKIYNEYNNGCLYQYEIAEKYNTTQSVISRIVNNKHWTTENLNV